MQNNKFEMHVGIDLGTTNTVVAICRPRRRQFFQSVLCDINQYKYAKQMGIGKNLPSVLFFDNDGTIKVGEYAKHKKADGADKRVLYNTKLDMGKKDATYDNGFTPVLAAAEILKVCRESIKTYLGRSDEFPTVTITVPASFTQSQIADTLSAAKIAGFDTEKIDILEEPVAALYHYMNEQMIFGDNEMGIDFSETKRVLIYDIGGGTCDVCIVDIKATDDYDYDIKFISTNRYTEFGGNDFDEQAAIGLLNKLFKRYSVNENEIDSAEIKNNLVSSIIPFCEIYKLDYSKQLVNNTEDNIINTNYASLPRFLTKYENVELDVSYKEYKKYTEVFFKDNYIHQTRNLTDKMRDKNIIKPVYQLLNRLEKAGEKSIDCVFLTGGMSQYRPIEEALSEYCKCPVLKTESPMESVALGAAISRFIKARVDKETVIQNEVSSQKTEKEPEVSKKIERPKLAESIFIGIENSLPMKIIDADTSIPCKGKVDYVFHVSSTGVCFNLFAGQTAWDPEMRILYDYSMRFDKIVPPNTEATITYEINENRFLKMYLELKDVRKQKLELTVDNLH